jgi:predicted permease
VGERHRFDPGALVAGLYFLAVAGVFLTDGFAGRTVLPLVYTGVALLIGYSLVLLVRVLTRDRRRQ